MLKALHLNDRSRNQPVSLAAARLAIVAAMSLPALTLAQVAELPVAQDFIPGERWTWQRTDDLSHRSLTFWRSSIEPHDDILFVGSTGRRFRIDQVYRLGTWRQWPLSIGKTWTHKFQWAVADGSGETTMQATVVAWEDVVVPAGTYKAFRIEYHGFWTMTNYANFKSGGQVTDVYWYAPDVKADVRQTHHVHSVYGVAESWTSELMSYVRSPTN